MSITLSIKNNIESKLIQIEQDKNVEILLAVESGSRAWGFESLDSDYDVRFIYKHGFKWYLNILPKRDVIELPINDIYDYSGWDIRKTLWLLNKSNPVLLEWLHSPIVYKKDSRYFDLLYDASTKYFSPVSSIYHYLHMAKGNYREYLQGDIVKTKKYFYVLRPLLACMWIDKYDETPPVEFELLLKNVSDIKLLSAINELLELKRNGAELGIGKAIPVINKYIQEQLDYFDGRVKGYSGKDKPSSEYLDNIFYSIIFDRCST